MDLKRNLILIKNFFKILFKDYSVIIYSENIKYQSIFRNLTLELNQQSLKIAYLSSDENDKIDSDNVDNFFIGNKTIRDILLQSLNCKVVIMTLTDLGYHSIKKSKKVDKYVYLFHGIVGGYSLKAFSNYDVILSPSNYHNDLIKKNYGTEKDNRKIFNTGYLYFDHLKNIPNNFDLNTVMIAPSWSRNYPNFINEDFIKICDFLLNNKLNVIFRPHPEHLKRSKKILDLINHKFKSNKFMIDYEKDNIKSFSKSSILITDFSGVGLEFSLSCYRQTIYLSSSNQKHTNEKEINYLEEAFKKEFGIILSLENFFQEFNNIRNKKNLDKKKLIEFGEKNFFNFGKNISKISAEKINKLVNLN